MTEMKTRSGDVDQRTYLFLEPLLAVFVVIALSALAYLPLIHQLGYYHDDWFTVASRVSGVSLIQMHSIDRPVMGRVYSITHGILGDTPLYWQLAAFIIRMAGALAFLWLLRMVWKGRPVLTTGTAALFIVYPGFLLQANANNYLNHLISLALGIFSLALMVRSLDEKHLIWKVVMIVPSVLLVLVYPRIYETMIGLEAMRLVLLVYLLAIKRQATGEDERFMRYFKRMMFYWLPYLVACLVFFYWRFIHFRSVRTATDTQALFEGYVQNLVGALLSLIAKLFVDVWETIVSAWFVPLVQRFSQERPSDILFSLLLAAVTAIIVWAYLKWARGNVREEETCWLDCRDAFRMGLLVVFLTLLPMIAAGRDVEFRYNLDRFTLQSMMGAVMVATALVLRLKNIRIRTAGLLLLVCIGVVTHYHNAVYYRDFWQYEREFWWQLSWRAPQLKKDTSLVALLPQGYRLAEGFEIWAPASLIYADEVGPLYIQAEVLNNETAAQIASADSFERDFRTIQYTVDFRNLLLASMPGDGVCLHLYDGQNIEPSSFDDGLVIESARYSNLTQIEVSSTQHIPPGYLFGVEPEHEWCYYYQKAVLARQAGNWVEVVRLADEARACGLTPVDVSEWLPFYQGYAMFGRINELQEISSILKKEYGSLSLYCAMRQENDTLQIEMIKTSLDEICVLP